MPMLSVLIISASLLLVIVPVPLAAALILQGALPGREDGRHLCDHLGGLS